MLHIVQSCVLATSVCCAKTAERPEPIVNQTVWEADSCCTEEPCIRLYGGKVEV